MSGEYLAEGPPSHASEASPAAAAHPELDSPDEGLAGRRLTLAELADLAGMTPRNVRAYQQRGLLSAPHRQGRKAYYTWEHLTRLRIVAALHEHGLTLKVIGDLIERGTADSELVRLGREEVSATWTRSVRVPMADVIVEWLERNTPQDIDRLTDAGIVDRRGNQLFANSSGLGVTAALSRRNVTPDVSTRVAIASAEAARVALGSLLEECENINLNFSEEDGREIGLLLMQLSAICYADIVQNSLMERLSSPRR